MRLFTNSSSVVAALSLAALASTASATKLTFDFGGSDSIGIPQTYGDRVGLFPPPAGWSYGPEGGQTPHIEVQYTFGNSKLGGINPNRVFGDLTNVCYLDRNAVPAGILEITIAADAGYLACLSHFEMAAIFNSVTMVGENLPAKSIQVRDESGIPIFQLDFDAAHPIGDPLSTYVPGVPPLTHRNFDFVPPLQSQRLTIYLDFTQLVNFGGLNKVDRVGIDNIIFSEKPVPTPGAASLILGAGAMLLARRRRR